jgi:hypothetical protein
MLRNKRLTRQIAVPVSAGLLTNTDAYFDALGSYREGDLAPIVQRLFAASVLAVMNGRHLVGDLRLTRWPIFDVPAASSRKLDTR